MSEGLGDLFDPRSIAIVGLSGRPGSTGRRVVANIRRSSFAGPVYGVHPSGHAVDGIEVFPSLSRLPEVPSVVLVCTPSGSVAGLLAEAGELGCRAAVVFASGFEETAAGRKLAEEVARVAGQHGIALVGPNCLGLFNPGAGVWLTGTRYDPDLPAGCVAVVSQTGSGCILLGATGRLGFSYVISSGNESVTTTAAFVERLVADAGTRVVALVLEGISQAERLAAAVRAGRERGVATVALKIGRTELGAQSVASHTGKVAGDARRFDAYLRRAGITAVADFDELVEALVALSTVRDMPTGDGVAFVGLSGGETGLVADIATESGLRMSRFSAGTVAAIASVLPGFGTVGNPLDGTGQLVGDPDRFSALVTAVATDPGVALLVVVLDSPPRLSAELAASYQALLAALPSVRARTGTCIVVLSNHAGGEHPSAAAALDGSDIPLLRGTRAGIAAVRALAQQCRSTEPAAPPGAAGPDPRVREVLDVLAQSPVGPVPQPLIADLARRYSIPLPRRMSAETAQGAVEAAQRLGLPVVLKTASPRAIHKSDVGGVAVGLSSARDVAAAFQAVTRSVGQHLGDGCAGVFVEEMVVGGVEAFVGCTRDPTFGPVLAVGVGGTLVEVMPAPAVALLPVSATEVRRMLAESPLGRLLTGYRGRPQADVDAFVDLVLNVGRLAEDLREVAFEIDLNPVAVLPRGRGVRVLDARILRQQRADRNESR